LIVEWTYFNMLLESRAHPVRSRTTIIHTTMNHADTAVCGGVARLRTLLVAAGVRLGTLRFFSALGAVAGVGGFLRAQRRSTDRRKRASSFGSCLEVSNGLRQEVMVFGFAFGGLAWKKAV
jgi:hypothetical protein